MSNEFEKFLLLVGKKRVVSCPRSEVTFSDVVPHAGPVYYKGYSRQQTGGVVEAFWSLVLVYFGGLASWRWRPVKKGLRGQNKQRA